MDDPSGQFKLVGWLYIVFKLIYTIFIEEASFHWQQFGREGTIFCYFVQKLVVSMEFHFMVHALLGELVIWIKLFLL